MSNSGLDNLRAATIHTPPRWTSIRACLQLHLRPRTRPPSVQRGLQHVSAVSGGLQPDRRVRPAHSRAAVPALAVYAACGTVRPDGASLPVAEMYDLNQLQCEKGPDALCLPDCLGGSSSSAARVTRARAASEPRRRPAPAACPAAAERLCCQPPVGRGRRRRQSRAGPRRRTRGR